VIYNIADIQLQEEGTDEEIKWTRKYGFRESIFI
jgi:hypothetical protein